MYSDLRFSLRVLRRSPGFSLSVILMLALGIAAEISLFAVIHTVLLKPLPFKDPSRLAIIWSNKLNTSMTEMDVSFAAFRDWAQQSGSFSSLAAFTFPRFMDLSGAEYAERVEAAFVTSSLLPLLGTQPAMGRIFAADEDHGGKFHVALLSYDLWQRSFGGEAKVIGQTIRLNDVPYTVVGILPDGFYLGSLSPIHIDVLTPLDTESSVLADRSNREVMVIGRLKPGIPIKSAQAEMNTIAERQAQQYPETDNGWAANVVPINYDVEDYWGPSLHFLGAAVTFVFVMLIATLMVLFITRTTMREQELVIRLALGGSYTHVLRQTVLEGALLTFSAAGLGLLIANAILRMFVRFSPPFFPRIDEVGIDTFALEMALAIAGLLALFFGVMPLARLHKRDIEARLNSAGRTITLARPQQRFHSFLMASQVAVAVIVGIAAGLLLKNFARLSSTNFGFDPANMFTVRLLPSSAYSDKAGWSLFYQDVMGKLTTATNSQLVAMDSNLPMTSTDTLFFSPAGRQESGTQAPPAANAHIIGGNYFNAMRIPVLQGRDFTVQDSASNARVVIINRTLADRFFHQQDPIGHSIHILSEAESEPGDTRFPAGPAVIVGVVGDTVDWALATTKPNQLYFPFAQNAVRGMYVLDRSTTPRGSVFSAVRNILKNEDPHQPVREAEMMDDRLSSVLYGQRLNMTLAVAFAGMAALLAVLGIYGVMAYLVSNRSREFAIRMALGATPRGILLQVVGGGMRLIAIGLVIGAAGAYILANLLNALLFDMSPRDPQVMGGIVGLIAIVALIGTCVPAARAAAFEPITRLRSE